ncbi:MAG: GyrI-like domain-containing protein [Anaerolineae bacterium]
MDYVVELKDANVQPAACIRTTTTWRELSATIGRMLYEISRYLEDLGLPPAGPPFVRYHISLAEELDIEVGLPLMTLVEGRPPVYAGELPGGTVASTIHRGAYDTLRMAYEALEAWMKDHGYSPAGPPWEVYWTDPGELLDPGEWRTEVVWPVE